MMGELDFDPLEQAEIILMKMAKGEWRQALASDSALRREEMLCLLTMSIAQSLQDIAKQLRRTK